MQEQKRTVKMPHTISIDDRKQMKITGVSEVDSFDEQTVVFSTDLGRLTIKGENLKITGLDVLSGDCAVTGTIFGLAYSDDRNVGFMRRLFK